MRSKYFFGFTISFIIGVSFESIFGFGYAAVFFCAVLALVFALLHERGARSVYSFFVSLVFLGCAVGVLCVDVSQERQNIHALDAYVNTTVTIEGIVLDEPDVRENYVNIVLEPQLINDSSERLIFNKKPLVLVRVPSFDTVRYGDKVMLTGKIVAVKNFTENEGSRTFDYRSYLAKDDIFYQMYFPSITIVSSNNGNVVREKLLLLKSWLLGNIMQRIPEPEASLGAGITLGAKQSLGEELLVKFRETGVAHIVVLSGYNIAVVVSVVSRMLMFMPLVVRLIVSAFGVLLFAVMVGGGATVVRATIMVLIVILARAIGRESDALRALVLAGALMIFLNPMILLSDVSFQLSFAAALSLVVLVPIIEKYFSFIPFLTFREIVVTTLATQIFVLPIILYHMGSVSLVGLATNIFILPIVPLVMFLVAVVAVFGWVPFVGSTAAFGAYLILAYILSVVDFFARVPFASLHDIPFSLWALVSAYTLLAFLIVKKFPSKDVEKQEYEF